MKTPSHASAAHPRLAATSTPPAKQGFALVVTLSLMVLLTILALGLLSLSTVELRSMGNSDSRSVARANALLALQIAIGDLQASAGPDQRITAPSGIIPASSLNQKMLTGVWKSRKLGPASTPSDFSNKTTEFVTWLVSNPNRTLLKNQTFVNTDATGPKGVIDLVSAANLDPGTPGNPPPIVQAAKVPVRGKPTGTPATSKITGTYAYAVLDEGTKARVNLGDHIQSPGGSGTPPLATSTLALGSGQRPILDGIPGIGAINPISVDLRTPAGRTFTGKMVTLPTADLAYATPRGSMHRKLHDLTATSVGLLTDVANGGLKKDLNLLAELKATGTLPPTYANQKIYQQAFPAASIKSDPSWDRALSWASIFYNNSNFANKTVGGSSVPTLTASAPPGWAAGTGRSTAGDSNSASATLSELEAPGPVLLPAIAKIQMSFSLTARDVYAYPLGGIPTSPKTALHNPWAGNFQTNVAVTPNVVVPSSPYNYLLHMVFSPFITLHNPYNVPLSFNALRVEFVNVPFAFQVFRNNIAQTLAPVPFSRMYGNSTAGGKNKRFGLTLTDTLLPGEVKIYSPNIPPGRTWEVEQRADVGLKQFQDWGNTNMADNRKDANAFNRTATDTSTATGIPGWNGYNVGYDLDFLCPGNTKAFTQETFGSAKFNRWDGIPLQASDTIYVESTPITDPLLTEKTFSVEMTLASGTAAKARSTALIYKFDNGADVQEVLMANNPQAQNLRIRAPRGTDVWVTPVLFDHQSVPIGNASGVKPFALFSAYAKTTNDGDIDKKEGFWVAKPYSFQNEAAVAMTQWFKKGHPSNFSHELALTRYPDVISASLTNSRSNFITGHSLAKGRGFGTIFDVPLAPFQSLISLNSAQLASGSYLPHFTAPVGNSYAHPLIPTGNVTTTGSAVDKTGATYSYADHSFLLNSALFDSYYCSGLQSRAPIAFGSDAKSRTTLATEFVTSGSPTATATSPLADPGLKLFLPDGMTPATATTALTGTNAYLDAASLQVVEGAFNVNSTSVPAWKALLSSMSSEQASLLVNPTSVSGGNTLSKSAITPKADPKGARFSRFRLPNGPPDRNDPDAFWRGSIDLTPTQVEALAKEIVTQIKLRGPFLSMAEFVNRQLGPSSNLTLKGTLQAAIDTSGMNNGVSAATGAGKQITLGETTAPNTGDPALANPEALVGDSAQGAPGYLMQSDILAVLGNKATVRSDTFTIRAYGEAINPAGNVTARAFCEAVVQRTPEFVDSSNKATTPITLPTGPNPDLTPANLTFGRRFAIISLRWLSPTEL